MFGFCAFYLFLLGVLSIFFNSSIFWLYFTVSNLRTDFNLLLMNLLAGELVVAFYGIPVDFYAAARRGWDMGPGLCQFTGFLLTFLGMASINNLVTISIFRYLTIRYVNSNFAVHSRKVVIGLIVLSWSYSLLLALPPLLGWGKYVIESNGMSCAPSWKDSQDFGYNISLFVLGFFVPLAVIIFTGVRILFIVRKHLASLQSTIGETGKKKEEKLTQMIVIMSTVFVICWGPYAAQSLAGVLQCEVPPALTVFPLQFAKLAVLANPLIYVIMNKTFQKAFITLLPNSVGQIFAEKVGIERGTLSDTAIGRRQHPKFFGRLWPTWARSSSVRVTSKGSQEYFE